MAKRKKPEVSAKLLPKSREQRAAERQTLAMWALLGAGGAAFGSLLKPEIDKAERDALAQAGLIDAEKRARGAWWLTVTDKGWDWAERHLPEALPDKTFAGAFVLRAWLTRLSAFMQQRNLRLAEVLGPQEPVRESPPASPDYADLRQRVRSAYLDITGGFARRALLKDLRLRLHDVDRPMLDAALRRMQREDNVSLMRLDNRLEITEADEAAALAIGNDLRHILWISD